MSNPDPGLARLVLTKCVFSCNVSLVYVGLEIGPSWSRISFGEF